MSRQRRQVTASCVCGKQFSYPPSQKGRRYCSTDCYNQVRQPGKHATVPCGNCGTPFTFLKSQHERRYCSLECAGKVNVANVGSSRSPRRGEEAACEQCRGRFYRMPYEADRRFCSRTCWYEWRKINLPPGHTVRVCVVCSGEFICLDRHKRPGLCCDRSCWAQYLGTQQRGEDHPHWKGGGRHYYGSSWAAQRDRARRRDKVCRDCGRSPKEIGRALDVHHVRRFLAFGPERHKEANHLDNLICYCRSCHHRHEWSDNNPRSS